MPKHNPPPVHVISEQMTNPDYVRPAPKLCFNWEDWLPYLESLEGTPSEKRELIETLWQIVCVFVDLGWEIGAKPDRCEQNFDLSAALRAAVVHSKDHQQKEEV